MAGVSGALVAGDGDVLGELGGGGDVGPVSASFADDSEGGEWYAGQGEISYQIKEFVPGVFVGKSWFVDVI